MGSALKLAIFQEEIFYRVIFRVIFHGDLSAVEVNLLVKSGPSLVVESWWRDAIFGEE